jgi:hypothetical protein
MYILATQQEYADDLQAKINNWRMPSSGMWSRVDLVWTDISEERIAFIFRVEKFASEEPAWAGGCRLSHQSKKRPAM